MSRHPAEAPKASQIELLAEPPTLTAVQALTVEGLNDQVDRLRAVVEAVAPKLRRLRPLTRRSALARALLQLRQGDVSPSAHDVIGRACR